MKSKLLLLLIITCLVTTSFAQDIPLVYSVENTGKDIPVPALPDFDNLPSIEPLPDPFLWADGSGRDTTFENWERHRNEYKAMIEKYEIGPKPDRPDDITASYSDGLLTVNITVNGNTLTLTSEVVLPSGEGPFPAVIGMTGGSGSLPSNIFSSRNIAQISFNFGQVMAHQQVRGNEPINKLYPELTYMGAYSAWPWGVSRLIDGLELVQDELPIDLSHLAVTGCSFAGKMALFAGAFDERIALTIAQESGGGGYPAWRVSETLGSVEKLGSTDGHWFIEDMFRFAGSNVSKLPHDHHQLMAMVAPRALLVTGNPDFEWLADPAGYVSSRATQRVYETLGIPDRFGFSIIGGHGHCAVPASQIPEIEAFVEKFLLGNESANTNITTNPYEYINYSRWTEWWGTEDPVLPNPEVGDAESIYLEAECAKVGKNWSIKSNESQASGASYVASPEIEFISAASSSDDDHVVFNFTVKNDTTYYLYTRLNCPSADDDSYWMKMDDGAFVMQNGLATSGWEWKRITNYKLSAGEHTFTLANRENGAGIDKICISDSPYIPEGMGGDAVNCLRTGIDSKDINKGYSLNQNFPNPFDAKTNISFVVPNETYVSLKVFNINGSEIAELAGKNYFAGKHYLEFYSNNIPKGIYVYKMKTDAFTASQKMTINN
ncbi:T9SS type A sorting domain-containing protein [uncultured Draconibacterium sp.]|uniref:glucuronyl esterase domain-containing protein n=1 Tax=uncultured Draconibacterium sp. TaxID=1573823 RepID=UPI0025F286C1|nr:T9SS type A sorting domain-containing protein [uncultured Draconibacterium sp.]